MVHARAVLTWLPAADRDAALGRMVGALKPGGWLMVTASDGISVTPDPSSLTAADLALVHKTTHAYQQLVATGGADFFYGRQLYGAVRRQGLVDLGAEGRVDMVHGGSPPAQFSRLGFERLRDRLVSSGLLTAAEVERRLALFDQPDVLSLSPINMVVWGRRPPG